MLLNKIELKGFKSFADRLEIDFMSGITCVVGPNGSGKSNITDAIRWVLGEQKARILRGDKMEDVIFNGTKHRKPLNFAEVTLYFDNRDGFFENDLSELSVRRRVHRSGESEYFINNAPCRLKDIRELFMDTGVGIDGYSIIGQGTIDSILSDNKFDRRRIFEEASGIVKYHYKKSEAERRLERARLNLERVNDIYGEVKQRVEPLRIEKERAEEFLQLEKAIKISDVRYLVDDYDKTKEEVSSLKEEEKMRHKSLETLLEEKSTLYEQRKKVTQEIQGQEERLEALSQQLAKLVEKRDQELMEMRLGEEKVSSLQVRLESLKNTKSDNSQLEESLIEEIKVLQANKLLRREEIKALTEEMDQQEQLLEQMREKIHFQSTSKDELRDMLHEKTTQVERLRGEISRSSAHLSRLQQQALEQDTEREDLQTALHKGQNELKDLLLDLDADQVKYDAARNQYKEKAEAVTKEHFVLDELKENLEEKRRAKYRASSELELLIAMEARNDQSNQGLKQIMKFIEKSPFKQEVYGLVSELLVVPTGYEEAMATALGGAINNIVTANSHVAKEIIKGIKEKRLGRATFLPVADLSYYQGKKEHFAQEGFLGYASDLVTVDQDYEAMAHYLLGSIVVAKDIEAGSQIAKQARPRTRIVTLDGDLIIAKGPMTGGSKFSKKSNLFANKKKRTDLEEKIKSLTQSLLEAKKAYQEKEAYVEALEESLEKIKEMGESYQQSLQKKKTAKEVLESNLSNLTQGLERGDKLREKSRADIVTEEEHIEELTQQIQTLSRELDLINGSFASEHNNLYADEKRLSATNESLTNLRIQMAKHQAEIESMEKEIGQKQARLEDLRQGLEGAVKDQSELEKQIKGLKDLIDEATAQYSSQVTAIHQVEEGRSQCRNDLHDAKKLITQIDDTYYEAEGKIDALKEEIHQIEVKIARLETKISNVSGKLWELYELSIIEAKHFVTDEEVVSKAELGRMKKRLQELGHVNVQAIEEYEEVKERYEFLTEQIDDLTQAEKDLRTFIKSLEVKMKKSFEETFSNIQASFKLVFSELFAGGEADLLLTNPEDILESDIQILASPPGKALQNISLLSGGEKALTAIALLFAVLKAKPAPFCILDEIEAALDDVNIHRFGQFLKRFSLDSQFILITHRKGTMEFADALYGVSMEEYGVSKVVSLKLQ